MDLKIPVLCYPQQYTEQRKLESISKFCASGKESVDRQWQALSIREIDTIRYYDLNVYRYLKGERKKNPGGKTFHLDMRSIPF